MSTVGEDARAEAEQRWPDGSNPWHTTRRHGFEQGASWQRFQDTPPDLPVPPGTVAVLRFPMPVDGLVELMPALAEVYGPDLVVVTDAGLDGWMVVARKVDHDV